uniref:Uncharacterized protein n=1 Tax=Corethron hystrix TaxID=216773 RepID=A0A7S1BQJ7_9STRA|mmetsp:Transcript_3541/g.6547  ORF Transcript_3541/g.6547 Transcript_3541/m.6547 type:complete len:211 (+) Transcript_3541:137-769(+)
MRPLFSLPLPLPPSSLAYFPKIRCFPALLLSDPFPPPIDVTADSATPPPTVQQKKCDPYGNAGQPLSASDVRSATNSAGIDFRWRVVPSCDDNIASPPRHLRRTFVHPSLSAGGTFVSQLSLLSEVNGHGFFSVTLRRNLGRCPLSQRTTFVVRTDVTLRTEVVGGLSYEDVHLAMLTDAEVAKDGSQGGCDVKSLLFDVMEEEGDCEGE